MEALIYTLRPHGPKGSTALWLPASLATKIGARKGDLLTEKQFNCAAMKKHLSEIREREKRGGKLDE